MAILQIRDERKYYTEAHYFLTKEDALFGRNKQYMLISDYNNYRELKKFGREDAQDLLDGTNDFPKVYCGTVTVMAKGNELMWVYEIDGPNNKVSSRSPDRHLDLLIKAIDQGKAKLAKT